MSEFVHFTEAQFSVEKESRTLTGLVLPFNQTSGLAKDPKTGKVSRFSFAEGTVTLPDPSEVILNYGHDTEALEAQVGIATELALTPEGVVGKFKIANTPEGDRILALAADRILRSFSAEMEGSFKPSVSGVQQAIAAVLRGAAVVRKPAFAGAHITSVAASAAAEEKEIEMAENTTVESAPVAFSEAQGVALAEQVQTLTEKVEGLADLKIPVGSQTAEFQVREEPIYRFSGTVGAPSGFDFATDLLSAARFGDQAALERVVQFSKEHLSASPQFVVTGDVNEVSPTAYRPDLFLGQEPTPVSPLYDTFYSGALTNVQPFTWSKLDRAATNVGVADHTEGVEPTGKNFATAVAATVTPTAVSGKVHVTREVADLGGNPNVSGMVWAEFDRSFKVALEQKTYALINASMASITSLTAAIANAADGKVAGQAVEAGLMGLQFENNGSRFTRIFGQADLYTVLGLYENADGEKRYPILNPVNRSGSASERYSSINIAGHSMTPTASLVAKNSLIADPAAVKVWNSGLSRLEKLGEEVEGWDIGCFAYFAGVVHDITGLRKIAYSKA